MNEEIEEIVERLKARIPDAWGKWVAVYDGWVPMLGELDKRLAALDPDYVLLQCKDKFGGLRYYIESGNPELQPIVNEYEAASFGWPLNLEEE